MTQERTAPITSTPAAPSGLRLHLDPGLARQGVVDGAWWPHSRDPSAELPELIAGLDAQLGAITRVALNLDAWASAPRRLTVAGRTVRVGSFRAIDAHTVSVRSIPRERVVLLVVPPEATTAAAAIAMAMATDATDSARPADILAASGITAEMPPTATPPGTPGPGVGAAGSSRRAPGSSGAPTRIAPGGVSVQGNGAHSQSHQSRAAGREPDAYRHPAGGGAVPFSPSPAGSSVVVTLGAKALRDRGP